MSYGEGGGSLGGPSRYTGPPAGSSEGAGRVARAEYRPLRGRAVSLGFTCLAQYLPLQGLCVRMQEQGNLHQNRST